MAILISSLKSDQAQLILTCTNAYEIWSKLSSIYQKKSGVSVMNPYEEYFAIKITEDENEASYVAKVSKLASEIENQGEKLTDNIKMVRTISSLTPKFKNFKTIWYNNEEGRNLDNLLARLQLEEDQITKADGAEPSAAVFSATTYINKNCKPLRNNPPEKKLIFEIKKITTCNFCKKFGLWERECRNKKSVRNNSHKKTNNEFAFTSTIEDVIAAPCKEIWIADSGALQHMTLQRDWFTSFGDSDSEKFVKVANDERLEICGYGTILVDVFVENQ
ncbi:hypothetical protein JTB14_034896 [Gonioctena quinquepunctata]|nr:hypothetical protein JTB14_034896 [Gonioctena quinquepunctata]